MFFANFASITSIPINNPVPRISLTLENFLIFSNFSSAYIPLFLTCSIKLSRSKISSTFNPNAHASCVPVILFPLR